MRVGGVVLGLVLWTVSLCRYVGCLACEYMGCIVFFCCLLGGELCLWGRRRCCWWSWIGLTFAVLMCCHRGMGWVLLVVSFYDCGLSAFVLRAFGFLFFCRGVRAALS